MNDPQGEITRPPWEKGHPESHPAGQRGVSLGIPPADGGLNSLASCYLTTIHLKEFKDSQRTKLPKENSP